MTDDAVDEWETYIEEAIAATATRDGLVAALRLAIAENRLPAPNRCKSCGGSGELPPRKWGPPNACGSCLGSGVRR